MTTIAELDTEITLLQQRASTVERAPKSFDEVWHAVEAGLAEAEATFRRLGPQLGSAVPVLPEYRHQQHQVAIGAALVANRKALVDAERQRIGDATKHGLSATDKARKLEQLRGKILRAAAQRELLLREREATGEFQLRDVHPELVVYKRADLELLAR